MGKNKLKLCQMALLRRHLKGAIFSEVTVLTHRMDMVAFDYKDNVELVTGYEIKVSRGDFLGDQKWKEYLPWCMELYFACPRGLIKKEEIPPQIGLIYCYAGTTRTVKRAVTRPMAGDNLQHLIFDLIWRRYTRDETRKAHIVEQLNKFLNNKIDLKQLGKEVSWELSKKLNDIDEKETEQKRFIERQGNILKLIGYLKEHRCMPDSLYTEQKLIERLKVAGNIEGILRSLDRAKKPLQEAIREIETIERDKRGNDERRETEAMRG